MPFSRFLFLFVLFALCSIARAQTAAEIRFADSFGRPAVGIVCDNLAITNEADLNYLSALLPDSFGLVTSVRATLRDGSQTDRNGALNTGRLEYDAAARRLKYFPPFEFNVQQAPDAAGDFAITPDARREIVLSATGTRADGTAYTVEKIVEVARPGVVLVHGINSGPGVWIGPNRRGIEPMLQNRHFVTATLNHAHDDIAAARPGNAGGVNFHGNGPVEYGAMLLDRLIEQTLQKRRDAGFATRRVDLVAHSYGGLIARWYLRSNRDDAEYVGSRRWYVNSNLPGGRDLYALPKYFLENDFVPRLPNFAHDRDVRKLITLATPWRGVPAANLINEVRGPAPAPDLDLSRLRIGPATLSWYVDNVMPIPVNVPSMEVLAINSPWLSVLNSRPFEVDVAYGALAGNDSGYLDARFTRLDLYTGLARLLPAAWFPYLALERRAGQRIGYSDGVVPVWSAVIPAAASAQPDETIVPATHDSILWHEASKTYVLQALSSATLSSGRELNRRWSETWNYTLKLPDGGERGWTFTPDAMAPVELRGIYEQRGGVGRIAATALRPIRGAVATRSGENAVITWTTLLPAERPAVHFYTLHREPRSGAERYVETLVAQRVQPTESATLHRVEVSGLKPDTKYFYTVESHIPNPPNDSIALSSRLRAL